jgi:FAD:protein FMN transferase
MTSPNQPTRRDFLHGRVVAGLVGDVARFFVDDLSQAIGPESPATERKNGTHSARSRSLLTSFRRRAMACEFEIQLPAAESDSSTEVILAALDLLEVLEAQLTIYHSDSEVLRINRLAVERPIAVEPRLFALLELAARLHQETDGALDLTTGPLSDAWGFSRREGRLPSEDEVAAALARVGMDKVELDTANRTVSFRDPGVALHINCIGKGYALDRMAERLAADAVENFLLHGGQSSVLARGRCPGSNRAGWTIGIPHPLRPGDRLGEVELVDEALGTSGSATQSFEHEGQRYGHLLNPRTGHPVTGIYTASAVAPTAAEADALSTAFYVMGPERVGEFCAARPEVAAILVCPDDLTGEPRLISCGLEDRPLRPLANS